MPTVARSSQAGRRKSPHLELLGLRINSGFSREDLAHRIGVGRETIRLAEAGFIPTPRVQFAIAREFGLTPLDLWPIHHQRRPQ